MICHPKQYTSVYVIHLQAPTRPFCYENKTFYFLSVKSNLLGFFTPFPMCIRRIWGYTRIQTQYFISTVLKLRHTLRIICREVKSHCLTNRGKKIVYSTIQHTSFLYSQKRGLGRNLRINCLLKVPFFPCSDRTATYGFFPLTLRC